MILPLVDPHTKNILMGEDLQFGVNMEKHVKIKLKKLWNKNITKIVRLSIGMGKSKNFLQSHLIKRNFYMQFL